MGSNQGLGRKSDQTLWSSEALRKAGPHLMTCGLIFKVTAYNFLPSDFVLVILKRLLFASRYYRNTNGCFFWWRLFSLETPSMSLPWLSKALVFTDRLPLRTQLNPNQQLIFSSISIYYPEFSSP